MVLLEGGHSVLVPRKKKLLIKITAAQNEVELSYHGVHYLYFLTVIFAVTII